MTDSQIWGIASAIITLVTGFLFSPYLKDWLLIFSTSIPWRTIDKIFSPRRGWLKRLTDLSPDVIVAINDGIVPGAILARNLGVTNLHYVIHDIDRETNRVLFSTLKRFAFDATGKKILIIDDQILRGNTMDAVQDHIVNQLGATSDNVYRIALFQYQTPTQRPILTIEAPRKTRGKIKAAPWSYTDYHCRRYRDAGEGN